MRNAITATATTGMIQYLSSQRSSGYFAKSLMRDPAHVRPPEAALLHGVQVAGHVRELVMNPMMRCPPQRTFFRRARRAEREDELKPPARLVAAMREVAVIRAGREEHARVVQTDRERDPEPAHSRHRNADDREDMHAPEWNRERVEVDVAPALGLGTFDSVHAHRLLPE
jgi:hypothetical protein